MKKSLFLLPLLAVSFVSCGNVSNTTRNNTKDQEEQWVLLEQGEQIYVSIDGTGHNYSSYNYDSVNYCIKQDNIITTVKIRTEDSNYIKNVVYSGVTVSYLISSTTQKF